MRRRILPISTRTACTSISTLLPLVLVLLLSSCALFPNNPPVARMSVSPQSGDCPLTVYFSASSSYDPDGSIMCHTWEFGDGAIGSGAHCAHVYHSPGSYTVRLVVEDNEGSTDSAYSSISAVYSPVYNREFAWRSHGANWTWEIFIPKLLYNLYSSRMDRYYCTRNYCGWYKYVLDSNDDEYIENDLVVGLLRGLADHLGVEDEDDVDIDFYYSFLQYCLDFVTAAIPYTKDSLPDEWPRYPIETLVDMQGDCEDTAILYASLLREFVPAVHLLFLPGHVAVGVPVTWRYIASRSDIGWYEYNDEYFVYVETTGDPPSYFEVGNLPLSIWNAWYNEGFFLYDVGSQIVSMTKGCFVESSDIHAPNGSVEKESNLCEKLRNQF